MDILLIGLIKMDGTKQRDFIKAQLKLIGELKRILYYFSGGGLDYGESYLSCRIGVEKYGNL
jgi:hypothetical protein